MDCFACGRFRRARLGEVAAATRLDSEAVRRFGWGEIEKLTMNFDKVIGSGGFSSVYLARFSGSKQSQLGAVKVHNGSERLHRVFRQELDILLRLHHRHIVKLLGYCDEQEEGALVFEYVPSGDLQERLHGGGAATIPWRSRMAIAFQLAQAIEYLHERCSLQIVHGDIKASNILLDDELNVKLCDFGFSKMGFSSTVLPPSKHVMMGSPGYTDPHYLRTGLASKKNDVYSFGVVILELVTGLEAFCSERGKFLTSIVGPMIRKSEKELETRVVAEMIDPRLDGGFDLEEAKAMVSIAAQCLSQSHTVRPSATQVLQAIREKIPSVALLSCPEKVSKSI